MLNKKNKEKHNYIFVSKPWLVSEPNILRAYISKQDSFGLVEFSLRSWCKVIASFILYCLLVFLDPLNPKSPFKKKTPYKTTTMRMPVSVSVGEHSQKYHLERARMERVGVE